MWVGGHDEDGVEIAGGGAELAELARQIGVSAKELVIEMVGALTSNQHRLKRVFIQVIERERLRAMVKDDALELSGSAAHLDLVAGYISQAATGQPHSGHHAH